MQKIRCLLMISVLLLGTCNAGEAASYYVDSTGGADSNSGTSRSAPWNSLGKVNSIAFQPGDTIHFKRGRVWTGKLLVQNPGTPADPITYRAYGMGAAPQIKNPGVTFGRGIDVTADWNVVQDFLLTDAHEAGVFIASGADHNIIRSNEITASGTGVTVSGEYNLITQNYVHDLMMVVNTPGGEDDYGAVCFWLYAGNNEISYNLGINCTAPSYDYGYDGGFVEVFSQGDNTYVHHNWAENTNGFFELGASGGGSAQNVTLAYNVMVDTGNAVCMHADTLSVANLRFENNTFVTTGGSGEGVFICADDLSALQVHNNIFYSNLQISNNGNFAHSHNLYHMLSGASIGYALDAGEKTGDPLFINLGARDLRLQAGSPAVDAGLNLGYTHDFEGKIVPVGAAPDIGAYEYGGQ